MDRGPAAANRGTGSNQTAGSGVRLPPARPGRAFARASTPRPSPGAHLMPSPSRMTPLRGVLVGASLIAGLAMAGCHSPKGGLMPSADGSQTFVSYENRQVRVTMVDLRDGEPFFAMDVPAGQQLTYQIHPGEGNDPVLTPDLMRYMVWPAGTNTGRLRNALAVPPRAAIRVDVDYLSGVEYRPAPPEERYRIDKVQEQPAWWSPAGGPVPDENQASSNYEG